MIWNEMKLYIIYIVWYDMIWYDMIWYDMLYMIYYMWLYMMRYDDIWWYIMIYYDMLWYVICDKIYICCVWYMIYYALYMLYDTIQYEYDVYILYIHIDLHYNATVTQCTILYEMIYYNNVWHDKTCMTECDTININLWNDIHVCIYKYNVKPFNMTGNNILQFDAIDDNVM